MPTDAVIDLPADLRDAVIEAMLERPADAHAIAEWAAKNPDEVKELTEGAPDADHAAD